MKNYLGLAVLALTLTIADDVAAQQLAFGQSRASRPAGGNPWEASAALNRQRQLSAAAPQRAAQPVAARAAQQQFGNAIMPYSTVGSAERAPTGHVTAYMNFGGYYTPTGNFGGYYPQQAPRGRAAQQRR